MTPIWIALALPLAELGCAGWLLARTGRRYPALIAYLLTEALWHSLALIDYRISTRIGTMPRMVTRYYVVAEVFRLSRSKWGILESSKTGLVVLGGIMAATIAMKEAIHLSPVQSLFVFRQYYYVAMAAALWALIARSYWWPLLENRLARAYRYWIAVWITAIAIPGTFVTGGLGYLVFPHTDRTWNIVNVVAQVSIFATAVAITLALASRPERTKAVSAARQSTAIIVSRAA